MDALEDKTPARAELLSMLTRSGTVSVDRVLSSGVTGTIGVYGTSIPAVLLDITKTVTIRTWFSADGGSSWTFAGGGTWSGGSLNKDGSSNEPGIILNDVARFQGGILRTEMDLSASVPFGVEHA